MRARPSASLAPPTWPARATTVPMRASLPSGPAYTGGRSGCGALGVEAVKGELGLGVRRLDRDAGGAHRLDQRLAGGLDCVGLAGFEHHVRRAALFRYPESPFDRGNAHAFGALQRKDLALLHLHNEFSFA